MLGSWWLAGLALPFAGLLLGRGTDVILGLCFAAAGALRVVLLPNDNSIHIHNA